MQTASSLEIVPQQNKNNYEVDYCQRLAQGHIGQVQDRLAQDFHAQFIDAIFFPSLDVNSTFGFSSFENEQL